MKRGHIPIRQCIGCRRRRPGTEMIRLTVLRDEVVMSPKEENRPGRGCYICPDEVCLDAALNIGRLGRAFRRKIVKIPSKGDLL